jgi:nitroimidazol reductase NimA-like FMN-containing flavoprotein (pyridoxamine 5'-phosphate oxidase superfamily)
LRARNKWSVFNHSMNYRSAMIFGVARLVTEPEEQMLALRTITEHLVPGQWSYARQPSKKELAATSALALQLTEASVKIRPAGRQTSRRTTGWTSGRAWCRWRRGSGNRSRTPC